jgi:hypothetical protein
MNNLLMTGAPPRAATSPQPFQFTGSEVTDARGHLGAVMGGLLALAAKPKGSLSKQDVYNAAADMIGQGAFSTPQAKQALVAQLAQLPDDEGSIRQMVGQHLMRLAGVRQQFHSQYGES